MKDKTKRLVLATCLALVFGVTLPAVFSGPSVLAGGGGIALNPRAYQPAVDVVGLSASRLSTLEGKTVYVVDTGHGYMPELAVILQETFPTCDVRFVIKNYTDILDPNLDATKHRSAEGEGVFPPGIKLAWAEEIAAEADAVIAGEGF